MYSGQNVAVADSFSDSEVNNNFYIKHSSVHKCTVLIKYLNLVNEFAGTQAI